MKGPPHTRPPDFRWGGLSTCLCLNCGQYFTAVDVFERHFIMDQSTGIMECFNPADVKRQDGSPMFERVEKPDWNPPYVWTKYHPPTEDDGWWTKLKEEPVDAG